MGIYLFYSLGYFLGRSGYLEFLALICICGLLAFLSAISLSKISSNGSMLPGGIYRLIKNVFGKTFAASLSVIAYTAAICTAVLIAQQMCESIYVISFIQHFKSLKITNIIKGKRRSSVKWWNFKKESYTHFLRYLDYSDGFCDDLWRSGNQRSYFFRYDLLLWICYVFSDRNRRAHE